MSLLFSLLQSLRPRQWVKQLFVLAPLLFSVQFTQPAVIVSSFTAMLSFLCLSCTIYLWNDIRDAEADRGHPRKKLRPIASGALPVPYALAASVLLLAGGLGLAYSLPSPALTIALIYVLLNIVYSFYLKQQVVLDVLCIASGFVLRVLMGCAAVDVVPSPWIILTTFLLAHFLAFGKRYHEVQLEQTHNRPRTRPEGYYTAAFLDRCISIACGSTLISYALYAVETASKHESSGFIYTVGFVLFGLLRYLHAIYVTQESGEPDRVLFKDAWFLTNALLWLGCCAWFYQGF